MLDLVHPGRLNTESISLISEADDTDTPLHRRSFSEAMALPRTRSRTEALLVAFVVLLVSVSAKIVPANGGDISWPYHEYKTVNFTPPYLNITHHAPPSEGFLFFAPDGATPVQIAPVIMDMNGELVWNGPGEHAFNFGVYEYEGAPILGWWNGYGTQVDHHCCDRDPC